MIPIFIGYDPKEIVSYHVLCQSIMDHSSVPVSITPVNLRNMKDSYWRPKENQSTEFSFSRFLVPHLCHFAGHAIWMDCDILCRGDIAELYDSINHFHSVQVVKHDYVPKSDTKFLGNKQEAYPKKNWSSVMLFNCGHFHCRKLTPEYVNKAPASDLHQFKWTDRIGSLEKEWNHLVGEYEYNPNAKLAHMTLGGPWFKDYENCDYSDEWREVYQRTIYAEIA